MAYSSLYITFYSIAMAAYTQNHDNHPATLNLLDDPMQIVLDFLDFREQRRAQVISSRFNRWVNTSRTICADDLAELSAAIKTAAANYFAGDHHKYSRIKLDEIHRTMDYNEHYLLIWPRLLEEYVKESQVTIDAALKYQQIHFNYPIPTEKVMRALVFSSQMLLRYIFYANNRTADFKALHAFIYQVIWRYFSEYIPRNTSSLLPPLESVPFSHLNGEMYEQQMRNLRRLNAKYGLVVWHFGQINRLTASLANINKFDEHFANFKLISTWFDSMDSNGTDYSDFKAFLETEFILIMLKSEGFRSWVSYPFTYNGEFKLKTITAFIRLCRATLAFLHETNSGSRYAILKAAIVESGALTLQIHIAGLEKRDPI